VLRSCLDAGELLEDPQLVWRGKDEQDWSDLVVHAPPLYIQEKVHDHLWEDDAEPTNAAILLRNCFRYQGILLAFLGVFNAS
jgi:adenine-specific DNA-methyltransferase